MCIKPISIMASPLSRTAPQSLTSLSKARRLDGKYSTKLTLGRLERTNVCFARGYRNVSSAPGTTQAYDSRYQLRHIDGLYTRWTPHSAILSSPPPLAYEMRRSYADLKASSGKTEADLLVEELQELYEIAKDEFDIATDSTNAATIYAASDRESARLVLNHLTRAYTLYTEMTTSSASDTPAPVRGGDSAPVPKEPVLQNSAENLADGRTDPLVSDDPAAGVPMRGAAEGVVGITSNYDPEQIQPTVKEEVKRRVGQRIRELQNAMQVLEETAHKS